MRFLEARTPEHNNYLQEHCKFFVDGNEFTVYTQYIYYVHINKHTSLLLQPTRYIYL